METFVSDILKDKHRQSLTSDFFSVSPNNRLILRSSPDAPNFPSARRPDNSVLRRPSDLELPAKPLGQLIGARGALYSSLLEGPLVLVLHLLHPQLIPVPDILELLRYASLYGRDPALDLLVLALGYLDVLLLEGVEPPQGVRVRAVVRKVHLGVHEDFGLGRWRGGTEALSRASFYCGW